MDDRQRLEAIVDVVCKYLPPDGISREQAMNEIIGLIDPLPAQEQEPTWWLVECHDWAREFVTERPEESIAVEKVTPLYTAPLHRELVGLTNEVITKVIDSMPNKMRGFMDGWDLYDFTRAIEAKHKENNHG